MPKASSCIGKITQENLVIVCQGDHHAEQVWHTVTCTAAVRRQRARRRIAFSIASQAGGRCVERKILSVSDLNASSISLGR
jgi:hypothetical protein